MAMNIDKFRALNLEELRELYRRYLESCNLRKNTIQTSSNDTFYLWRNSSKEIFWDAVTSDNFEQEAREKWEDIMTKLVKVKRESEETKMQTTIYGEDLFDSMRTSTRTAMRLECSQIVL